MNGQHFWISKLLILITLSVYAVQGSSEIYSFLFKDVITSQGSGNINLFKAKANTTSINGTILEAFRIDNDGHLVFAVDVNEASDGSENSDSQGLAIKSATLYLTIDGVEVVFSEFTTRTRVLLMESGANERKSYYSLIGVGGSSLISPNIKSELTGTSIDSTLWFPITQSIANATSGRVEIVLLNSAKELGDPEAFYDFSNGYEEIALLTNEDVVYLESLQRGVNYAPAVITESQNDNLLWTFVPSSETFYIAAYEDLFPNRGDYDFNDLVVAYQLKIGNDKSNKLSVIRGNGYLIARGAEYNHDWYLGIDLPQNASGSYTIRFYPMGSLDLAPGYPVTDRFSGRIDLKLASDIKVNYFDGSSTYVNTYDYQQIVKGPRFEFEIILDTPVAHNVAEQAPFDPFLYVIDTEYEVHLVDKSPVLSHSRNVIDNLVSYKDDSGYPFALILNEDWLPPLAGVDLGDAYPEFLQHVSSNGRNNNTWFAAPVTGKIKNIPFKNWSW